MLAYINSLHSYLEMKLLMFFISLIWIFQLCELHLWHLGAHHIQKLWAVLCKISDVGDWQQTQTQKMYPSFGLFSLSDGRDTSLIFCATGTLWTRSWTVDQCRLITFLPLAAAAALSQCLPSLFVFLVWRCCFAVDFCTWETIFPWFKHGVFFLRVKFTDSKHAGFCWNTE